MRHVVDVRRAERHCPAAGQPPAQPPAAQPSAARRAVLLQQAALGDRERPGRAAMVVPVGVLAAFQASSQTSQASERCNGRYQRTSGSCTTRSAQSWPLAAILVVTAAAQPVTGARPGGPDLGVRPGLPAGARTDTPAMPQAAAGRPGRILGASAARSDDGDRHATSLDGSEHTPGAAHAPSGSPRAICSDNG